MEYDKRKGWRGPLFNSNETKENWRSVLKKYKLENSLDWVRVHPEKKAIVIASDVAKYELGSSGEYTQGAGAVSMLITSEPDLLAIEKTIGISMEHVSRSSTRRTRHQQ